MTEKIKERLDILLVELGLCSGRDRAKAAIMAGEVLVDGVMVDKAGTQVLKSAEIKLKNVRLPYVSRGGLKLAKAIEVFALDFQKKAVLDIGSSTGGFVDCALQNGASLVYAVDVGYGQLDWKLRQDQRVVVLEKTNARYLTKEQITQDVDWLTADASFISLAKVLRAAVDFLKPEGQALTLIKPQFEAGRDKVGKKGVVRSKAVHLEVLEKVVAELDQLGLKTKAIVHSPVTGPQGNIEYLLWGNKNEGCLVNYADIVNQAWQEHYNE